MTRKSSLPIYYYQVYKNLFILSVAVFWNGTG